jgi:hypothetical protein
MWRFTRLANRLNTLKVGLLSVTALTILYSCTDSTAPTKVAPSTEGFVAVSSNGTMPSYTVASVPFAPEAPPTVLVPRACNDCFLSQTTATLSGVPIGFSFVFFGVSYDKIHISSNGIVGFGPVNAAGDPIDLRDGCCTSGFIPKADVNNNLIALGWAHWVVNSRTQVKYETRGTAPNRRFLVQYFNVGEDGGNGHITAQLILYEGSNEIALHTTELNQLFRTHTITQGIENRAGNEAIYLAGRDSAHFSLVNDGVKFSPTATNQAPVITAPANLSVNTGPASCAASVNVGTATATDDAPGVTVSGVRSDALALDAAYPKGVTTITWTATDASGLTSSAPQTVTVSDHENPSITAPANIAQRVDQNRSTATVDVGTATAADNCPNVAVTATRSDNALFAQVGGYPLGVTTITWTATDAAGNVSTATQTVTISPNQAPVFSFVPPAIAANTELGACSAHVGLGTATATDDLAGVVITAKRSDFQDITAAYPRGLTIVTWTATDADQATATATQNVTVSDNEKPLVSAPANRSVRVNDGVTHIAVDVGTATATDNCPNVTVTGGVRSDNMPLGADYPVGLTTITWTARDYAGNLGTATQTVNVHVNQPPVISAPVAIAVNTTLGACSANVTPVAPSVTDDLPGTVIAGVRSDNGALNAPYPKGLTVITWTATDADGATATATQNVTVSDREKPSITAPANISVGNDPGLATAIVATGTPVVSDNCHDVSVTSARSDGLSINSPYHVGSTTITWTATDLSGNFSTATQTIVVNDITPPTISVPANFTVDATSRSGAVVSYVVSASDNIGVTSLSCSPASGSQFPIGSVAVNCTAYDAAGNKGSASFTVSVLSARDQLAQLIQEVTALRNSGTLTNGVANPLLGQLEAAALALLSSDSHVACVKLNDFVSLVGKKSQNISAAERSELLADAARIKNVLGCQ